MKKIIFIFSIFLLIIGCSLDDSGANIEYAYSKVIEEDIPESFEIGETYEIEITYLLPSACHSAAGIDVRRESPNGEGRRKIYVAGIGSFDPDRTECNIEDENLTATAKFSILIDENEPFTFYLWNGVNDNNEVQFTVIEVPVTGTLPSNN